MSLELLIIVTDILSHHLFCKMLIRTQTHKIQQSKCKNIWKSNSKILVLNKISYFFRHHSGCAVNNIYESYYCSLKLQENQNNHSYIKYVMYTLQRITHTNPIFYYY